MSRLHVFTSATLLVTTPSMLVHPQNIAQKAHVQKVDYEEQIPQRDYIFSYDEMLHLFDEIESGELEQNYSPEELERIKHFIAFIAKEGVLPDDSEESLSLEADIEELLHGEDLVYEYAVSFVSPGQYQYILVPTALNKHGEVVLCKSWFKKQWKNVKKFAKKHKKALIIGAAVVVAAAVIVVAVVATTPTAGAAAAGALGAAGSTDSDKKEKKDNPSSTSSASPSIPTETSSTLKSTIDNQISSFKEHIVQNQLFPPTDATPDQRTLSWEEHGRTLGSLFAHDSLNNFQHKILPSSKLAQEIQDLNLKYPFIHLNNPSMGHPEIDRQFSTDYTPLYTKSGQEINFDILFHQARGEKALTFGDYTQAIQDLGKVIDANPANPLPYLERGIAHFRLGQYDHSVEDYKQFSSQTQKTDLSSIADFSIGFTKGLPQGVYESGEGIVLFLTDFIRHPINTSGQIVNAINELIDLMRDDDWGVVAEALAPEVYQLVTQWNTLPSDQRGELAGYAVGKYGADILMPGALTKIAIKSTKSAQELASICKNLQIAQETLVLETVSGIGNSVKIAEIVGKAQTTAFLGEELGFTAREMGQLKQAGKLEQAIDSTCESWLAKSPSEAYLTAKQGGKHADLIPKFSKKPTKEIEKSIRSYEKFRAF